MVQISPPIAAASGGRRCSLPAPAPLPSPIQSRRFPGIPMSESRRDGTIFTTAHQCRGSPGRGEMLFCNDGRTVSPAAWVSGHGSALSCQRTSKLKRTRTGRTPADSLSPSTPLTGEKRMHFVREKRNNPPALSRSPLIGRKKWRICDISAISDISEKSPSASEYWLNRFRTGAFCKAVAAARNWQFGAKPDRAVAMERRWNRHPWGLIAISSGAKRLDPNETRGLARGTHI